MSEEGKSRDDLVTEWKKPAHGTQYFAALSACLNAMAVGAAIGYSSPATAALRPPVLNATESNGTTFYLTPSENNWFAGSLSIGALLGCIMGGFCINRMGRRGTMLASVVPLMGGWLLICVSQNLAMLLTGRILCGLTTGISSLVVPTYTTECASKDIRGTLGSGFQLFVTVGILYAYVLGVYITSWRWLTLPCAIVGVAFLIMAIFLKESPHYLLSKGQEEKARKSLQYFRGESYDIEPEITYLKDSLEEAKRNKVSLKDLKAPYIIKPLVITLLLMVFQQLCGINAVIYNISVIFIDANTDIPEYVSSIIVGIVQVLSTAAASLLIDRLGRKILLCLSSSVMSLSIVCLGIFFYEKFLDEEWAVEMLGWLPLVSLMVFISAFSIGYGPIPWLMMGEFFYPNVKETASSMATTLNWTFVFVITFTFGPLKDVIRDYGVYWLFGGIGVINFLFCLLVVPETKGKSIQETTAYFGAPTNSRGS